MRPEPVLRRALQRLLHRLRDGSANYFCAADQFKVRSLSETLVPRAIYTVHAGIYIFNLHVSPSI